MWQFFSWQIISTIFWLHPIEENYSKMDFATDRKSLLKAHFHCDITIGCSYLGPPKWWPMTWGPKVRIPAVHEKVKANEPLVNNFHFYALTPYYLWVIENIFISVYLGRCNVWKIQKACHANLPQIYVKNRHKNEKDSCIELTSTNVVLTSS